MQGLKADLEAEEALHSDQLAIEGPPGADHAASGTSEGSSATLREAEKFEIIVPQVKPLSPGEILGCTAPKLAGDVDALL